MASCYAKIKTTPKEFFDWAQKAIKENFLTLVLDNVTYQIQITYTPAKNTVSGAQVYFMGIEEQKANFDVDYLDEAEEKAIFERFLPDRFLASGFINEMGTAGFVMEIFFCENLLMPIIDSLLEEASFFVGISRINILQNALRTNDEIFDSQTWYAQALTLFIDGKSYKEIHSILAKKGFNKSTKTIQNRITDFRNELGLNFIPRRNEKVISNK
jgi:hypothetical protein